MHRPDGHPLLDCGRNSWVRRSERTSACGGLASICLRADKLRSEMIRNWRVFDDFSWFSGDLTCFWFKKKAFFASFLWNAVISNGSSWFSEIFSEFNPLFIDSVWFVRKTNRIWPNFVIFWLILTTINWFSSRIGYSCRFCTYLEEKRAVDLVLLGTIDGSEVLGSGKPIAVRHGWKIAEIRAKRKKRGKK